MGEKITVTGLSRRDAVTLLRRMCSQRVIDVLMEGADLAPHLWHAHGKVKIRRFGENNYMVKAE